MWEKRDTPIPLTMEQLQKDGRWPKQHLIEIEGPDKKWYCAWVPDVEDLKGHFPMDVLHHYRPDVYPYSTETFPFMTLDQVEAQVRQEDLIEDILVMRKVSLMCGDSNIGKTYVAMSMGLSIASGTPWMHQQVTQGGVLYILAEGSDDAGGRTKAWRNQYNVSLDQLAGFVMIGVPTHLVKERFKLMETVKAVVDYFAKLDIELVLVVIDTLRMVTTGIDENSSLMSEAIETAIDIRNVYGPHVMLPHHENKQGKYSGHSSLRSNVDEVINVKQHGESSDVLEVISDKRRGRAKKAPLTVLRKIVDMGEVDKFGNIITECVIVPCDTSSGGAADGIFKPKKETQQDKMLAILGRSGLTNSEWKAECEKALGMNPNTFQSYLKDIKASGAVHIYMEGKKYYRQIDPENEPCPKCSETQYWTYDGPKDSFIKMRCTKCQPHFADEHIFSGPNTTVSGKGK